MEPLRTLTSRAISLKLDDVDTDIIYPARFLLITAKTGLGQYAFADRREDAEFPIGPEGIGSAAILIAGRNFGCGSSREQAVWALGGLGIRVIIAPSFGDIFFSNCIKNGMLPIRASEATVQHLHTAAQANVTFTVDLERCTVCLPDKETLRFEIDAGQREALLNGWNEIGRIRALFSKDIERFELKQRQQAPWLCLKDSKHA